VPVCVSPAGETHTGELLPSGCGSVRGGPVAGAGYRPIELGTATPAGARKYRCRPCAVATALGPRRTACRHRRRRPCGPGPAQPRSRPGTPRRCSRPPAMWTRRPGALLRGLIGRHVRPGRAVGVRSRWRSSDDSHHCLNTRRQSNELELRHATAKRALMVVACKALSSSDWGAV
jgi:hypothetical protein